MSVPKREKPLPDPIHANWVWTTYRNIVGSLFVFWMDFRARGMDKVPHSGALLVSNHESFLDRMMIGVALKRPVSFLARHSLFRVPFIGWTLRNTYVLPIRREGGGTESIRESVRRMKHGFLVGIFPEGTRSVQGQPLRFRRGAAYVWLETQCELVLATIESVPPTLSKQEKWFQIPARRPHFSLELKKTDEARLAEPMEAVENDARQLNRLWQNYFEQEITT